MTACGQSATTLRNRHHKLTGLVFTEVVGGGYVPAYAAFAEELPDVAIFADGRIFSVNQGSSVGVDSKSAQVVVVERTVRSDDLQRIVDDAQAAGVTSHPPDLGHPSVTDLPTTTITLSTDGHTTNVDVYALGYTDGLTSSQRAARRRLGALLNEENRLATDASAGSHPQEYVPASFSVFAIERSEPATPSSRARRWSLTSFRSISDTGIGCVPVVGAANVKRIIALAATATIDAVWLSAGRRWQVVFRPDLPGNKPCS